MGSISAASSLDSHNSSDLFLIRALRSVQNSFRIGTHVLLQVRLARCNLCGYGGQGITNCIKKQKIIHSLPRGRRHCFIWHVTRPGSNVGVEVTLNKDEVASRAVLWVPSQLWSVPLQMPFERFLSNNIYTWASFRYL